jgi:hypothetical protein
MPKTCTSSNALLLAVHNLRIALRRSERLSLCKDVVVDAIYAVRVALLTCLIAYMILCYSGLLFYLY